MKEVLLKNSSNIAQCAYTDDGRRIEIAPYAVVSYNAEEAALLLSDCGHAVREYVPVSMPHLPGDKVWVANVSGSPFLPKTVKIPHYDRMAKEWGKKEVKNLTREPQPFVGAFNLNQGPKGKNLGRRPVEVPPHYRLEVPKALADWMISRCINTVPENRGVMVLCRAPTEFEPNLSWDLDDMILYGLMIVKDFHILYEVRSKADLKQDAAAIEKEARRINNVLFYYLVDERYALPTKRKFEAFKKAMMGKGHGAARPNPSKLPATKLG